MYIILSSLILLASLLLIGVVLIQKSKGGGLASNVGSYNQIMGVRKTTDFVEKLTWGLAIAICVLSIATSLVMSHQAGADGTRSLNAPQPVEQAAPAIPTAGDANQAPAADAPAAAPSAAAPAASK